MASGSAGEVTAPAGTAGEKSNEAAPATTGAPAAGGTTSVTGAPAPAATSSWSSTATGEHKAWLDSNNFPDLNTLVKSFRDTKSFVGVPPERTLVLPAKPDDADGWAKVGRKLGVPEKPEGYGLKAPEGADPARFRRIEEWGHKNNIPPKQLAAMLELHATETRLELEALETKRTQRIDADERLLEQEFGAGLKDAMRLAKHTAEAYGIDEEMQVFFQDKMGPAKFAKLMHTIGLRMGEDEHLGGEKRDAGGMSPAGAKAQIADLMKDSGFRDRYAKGDTEAVALWRKLHAIERGDKP